MPSSSLTRRLLCGFILFAAGFNLAAAVQGGVPDEITGETTTGIPGGVPGEAPRNLVVEKGLTSIMVLKQNWTEEAAVRFYSLAQGSKLIPYQWFLHLEQPGSQVLFRDAEYIRALGYLPRTPDDGLNPDGLPVGFVKDGGYVGLSCAACHTTQINYKGKGWLIDGGPTLGDAEQFQRNLIVALTQTLQDGAKFDRFAGAVLGASNTDANKVALKADLQKVLDIRQAYNDRNLPHDGAPSFGPGRVDAFGAILNEVTETFAQAPGNHFAANAPVSYPFLWDTPQHDKVQWNGIAKNTDVPILVPVVHTEHIGALGRNVGEVLGVFGKVNASHEGNLLKLHGYASSVNKENLIAAEDTLRNLWSPQWPQELGGINETLRAPGEKLYAENCISCHALIKRDSAERRVVASMTVVGTDQTMARNVAERVANTGVLKGRQVLVPLFKTFGATAQSSDMLAHMVQRVVLWPEQDDLLGLGRNALMSEAMWSPNSPIYAEVTVNGQPPLKGAFTQLRFENGKLRAALSHEALQLQINGTKFREDAGASDQVSRFMDAQGTAIQLKDAVKDVTEDLSAAGVQLTFTGPQGASIAYAYKGRPLDGIWATAPYLHNGSVPNLDELLKPAAKRVATFHLGSREFDPVAVGFEVIKGPFVFDTTLPGNSNAGHEYKNKDGSPREFSDLERQQLIEYLKTL